MEEVKGGGGGGGRSVRVSRGSAVWGLSGEARSVAVGGACSSELPRSCVRGEVLMIEGYFLHLLLDCLTYTCIYCETSLYTCTCT